MLNINDAIKTSKKVTVGGIAHVGDYCIVKYGRNNYWIYPSGKLYAAGQAVGSGDLASCVRRVFNISYAETMNVIIDNG